MFSVPLFEEFVSFEQKYLNLFDFLLVTIFRSLIQCYKTGLIFSGISKSV